MCPIPLNLSAFVFVYFGLAWLMFIYIHYKRQQRLQTIYKKFTDELDHLNRNEKYSHDTV
jgi:hypothetical protein